MLWATICWSLFYSAFFVLEQICFSALIDSKNVLVQAKSVFFGKWEDPSKKYPNSLKGQLKFIVFTNAICLDYA